MKTRATLAVLFCLLLSFTVAGMVQAQEPIDPEPFPKPPGTPELVLTFDKDPARYEPGETVTMTVTNIGTGPASLRPCPWTLFTVREHSSGEYVRMQYKFLCYAANFNLYPGQSVSTEWDQTYLIYEFSDDLPAQEVPPTGEQVPNGKYTVQLYGAEADLIIAGKPPTPPGWEKGQGNPHQ